MSVAGVLSEINIYPIKSLGGIKLNKAIITKRGVAHPNNTSVVDRFLCLKKLLVKKLIVSINTLS
jgi:uncharacterized protein YcbX